jgi:hypothetical protein
MYDQLNAWLLSYILDEETDYHTTFFNDEMAMVQFLEGRPQSLDRNMVGRGCFLGLWYSYCNDASLSDQTLVVSIASSLRRRSESWRNWCEPPKTSPPDCVDDAPEDND